MFSLYIGIRTIARLWSTTSVLQKHSAASPDTPAIFFGPALVPTIKMSPPLDGTMRVYRLSTGKLKWVSDMGGQCWAGKTAYIWRALDGSRRAVSQKYEIEKRRLENSMAEVAVSDGITMVYDTQVNAKELFERVGAGKGEDAYLDNSFYGLFRLGGGNDYYLSINSDESARYWKLCVTKPTTQQQEGGNEKEEVSEPGW
ncbi:hypothetical protein CC80DRAFT_511582 [Byssothecium circinans]|uniref:Uncharacterized protein n=1 Tax=Byssothecium circinans TaxID=147558 RepID=A0A6A5T7G6_9PLEO|nr:hypothetical protein CC80DRAFT_511582 [Byssothecium circinans]